MGLIFVLWMLWYNRELAGLGDPVLIDSHHTQKLSGDDTAPLASSDALHGAMKHIQEHQPELFEEMLLQRGLRLLMRKPRT